MYTVLNIKGKTLVGHTKGLAGQVERLVGRVPQHCAL